MQAILRLLMVIIFVAVGLAPVKQSWAEAITYTYDNLDRLTQVQYSDGTIIQYSYDQLGNRLVEQVTAPAAPAGPGSPAAESTLSPGQAPVIKETPWPLVHPQPGK